MKNVTTWGYNILIKMSNKEDLENKIDKLDDYVNGLAPKNRDDHRIIKVVYRRYLQLQEQYKAAFGHYYLIRILKKLEQ